MKLCDICKTNEVLDVEEVRTKSIAVMFLGPIRVLKITETTHPRKGTKAESFEEIDACPPCIGKALFEGEALGRDRATETVSG